jgi:hypothetical protein
MKLEESKTSVKVVILEHKFTITNEKHKLQLESLGVIRFHDMSSRLAEYYSSHSTNNIKTETKNWEEYNVNWNDILPIRAFKRLNMLLQISNVRAN